jgi:hypothetical protein
MSGKGNLVPGDKDGYVLTPEQRRSRRHRNIAIGLAIGAFVVLFYIVTIAKLGSHALDKPF